MADGEVRVRRVYDEPGPDDGSRILIDRLWPRGLRKADLELDEWLKDVAPSSELRAWFGHDPDRFAEFRRRYLAELDQPPASEALATLRSAVGTGKPLTLLTATKDLPHSHATVLAELLS